MRESVNEGTGREQGVDRQIGSAEEVDRQRGGIGVAFAMRMRMRAYLEQPKHPAKVGRHGEAEEEEQGRTNEYSGLELLGGYRSLLDSHHRLIGKRLPLGQVALVLLLEDLVDLCELVNVDGSVAVRVGHLEDTCGAALRDSDFELGQARAFISRLGCRGHLCHPSLVQIIAAPLSFKLALVDPRGIALQAAGAIVWRPPRGAGLPYVFETLYLR